MPEINNSAEASYSFDGSSDRLTATSNTFPINFNNSDGLSITKTANTSSFTPGDIVAYTITITNNSSSYLNGVRIIDNIGGGNLAYVIGSASLTSGSNSYPVTPVATSPLTFTLQQLAVGATMTLNYRCQVIFNLPSTVSQITNNVQGIGYTSSGTINGYAYSTIERSTSIDFSIIKSSNASEVSPRQNFNYYLTLSNNTTNSVTVYSLTDNLPANFNLVSVSVKIGNGATTTLSSSEYTLSASNELTIPSSTGSVITVPSNGTSIVTITGNFT